jgi:hypothetical protein
VSPRPDDRTGVAVIRVWVEPGPGGGLRARVTRTLDVASASESEASVASTPDEIVRVVSEWLAEFVEDVTQR